jgi:hypothetical protein
MKQRRNNKSSFVSVENILGLILAILIIFQILPSVSVSNTINNPIGVVTGLILVLILFLTMNPIVGFLMLIYLYEIIRRATNNTNNNVRSNVISEPSERNKSIELQKMNPSVMKELEEILIEQMAPIKNYLMGGVCNVKPKLEVIKI